MTQGILFTENHGRNFYLIKLPERFYFSDVFDCFVLFLASSFGNSKLCNCLGFYPQEACQQAQKWIWGSLPFLLCTRFMFGAISLYVLCCFPLSLSPPSPIHEILVCFMYLRSHCIFSKEPWKNIKLKIICNWIFQKIMELSLWSHLRECVTFSPLFCNCLGLCVCMALASSPWSVQWVLWGLMFCLSWTLINKPLQDGWGHRTEVLPLESRELRTLVSKDGDNIFYNLQQKVLLLFTRNPHNKPSNISSNSIMSLIENVTDIFVSH